MGRWRLWFDKSCISGDLKIEDTVSDLLQTQAPVLSVAVSGSNTKYKETVESGMEPIVVAGNSEKLWFLGYDDNEVKRWEWVTDVATSSGGVIDDTITALSFVPTQFSLPPSRKTSESDCKNDIFIGNPSSLNIMYCNGSVYTTDGDHGLPDNNITSLAYSTVFSLVDGGNIEEILQVWIGTTKGLVLWQKRESDPQFRYLNGQRWLAGSTVSSISVLPRAKATANVGDLIGDTIVVVAQEGITYLEQRKWTLEMKASTYEDILTQRHDRLGMTSGCNLKEYGDVSICVATDDDNNGLWTSLVVVAEYMRYAVTKDPEALKTASRFFNGIVLLNEVTGVDGLMGRSCCSPEEVGSKDVWLPYMDT